MIMMVKLINILIKEKNKIIVVSLKTAQHDGCLVKNVDTYNVVLTTVGTVYNNTKQGCDYSICTD